MSTPSSINARWWWLPVGAVALAALSLLGPHSPTYDPWAWLIWGREITHADLSTNFGPSWKPLPVVFTTVFALVGSGPAPLLWLIVARAGGLLAIALAYRLAARLAGVTAGVIAALALFLADTYVGFFWRGDSEGVLVALSLFAIERHLDGHRRQVFLLGAAAALLRPEVWPFLALYGLWLAWQERNGERRWTTFALVFGVGAAVIVAWFLPEYLGSGDWTRAASRAREPVADSPGQAAHPFLAVFTNSRTALTLPAFVGALLAIAWAARRYRRDVDARTVLAIAVGAAVLMLEVAGLAQGGFTGNLRYVTLAASLVCVLAGVGWAVTLRELRVRLGQRATIAVGIVCLLASAPFVFHAGRSLNDTLDLVRSEAHTQEQLPHTIAGAGGYQRLTACGRVATGPLQTQIVAWYLHLHEDQISLRPSTPGTIVATTPSAVVRTPGFRPLARDASWSILTSCAP